jgi:hypothetical protein
MPAFINKLAPQAVLLAVAVYWSWPSLMQSVAKPAPSESKSKKAAAPLEFSAAALSPVFPSPPKRNPFELPGATHATKTRTSKTHAKGAVEPKAAEVKDPSLVLNATCIVGQQRLALINGRVYKEKDLIKARSEDPVDWVLTDIFPHKVLLLHKGVPLQLGYTNGAPKHAATSATKKTPQKAAK